MRLFNTEMIFLHPPRTRFGYGRNAPGLSRYGRRPQTPHMPAAVSPARIDTEVAAPPVRVVVERAA